MVYRCVKANNSSDVLTVGYDEGQGGQDHNGVGTWQNFTFTEIPQPTIGMQQMFQETHQPLLKVVGQTVVLKDIEELI